MSRSNQYAKVAKQCFVADKEHDAEFSFTILISTIGKTPRQQKSTKSVALCSKHLIGCAFQLSSDMQSVTVTAASSLTSRKQQADASQIDATTASRALNYKRWHKAKEDSSAG